MTTHTEPTSAQSERTTLLWTAAVAALWLIVAVLRPGTTLHLGPLLVPVIAGLLSRGSATAVRSVVTAGILASAVIVALLVTGNLDGPALSPFPNALIESVSFLAIGTGGSLIYVRLAG